MPITSVGDAREREGESQTETDEGAADVIPKCQETEDGGTSREARRTRKRENKTKQNRAENKLQRAINERQGDGGSVHL